MTDPSLTPAMVRAQLADKHIHCHHPNFCYGLDKHSNDMEESSS